MGFKLIYTHFKVNINKTFIYFIIALYGLFLCYLLYISGAIYSFNKFLCLEKYLYENFLFKTFKMYELLINLIILFLVLFNQKGYQIINIINYSRFKNFYTKKIYQLTIIFICSLVFFSLILIMNKYYIFKFDKLIFKKNFINFFISFIVILEIVSILEEVTNNKINILISFIIVFLLYLYKNNLDKELFLLVFNNNIFEYKNIYLVVLLIVNLFILENIIIFKKNY